MKILYLFLIIAILSSCKPSKVEQLILDHEQIIGDTKTDLKMKIVELEKVRDFTASDSLAILEPYFEQKKASKIQTLMASISEDSLRLIDAEKKAKDKITGFIYAERADNIRNTIAQTKMIINIYETDCQETFLEPVYRSIVKFSENPAAVLYSVYDCKYSISNPLLNGAKQTITKTYFIAPDENSVVGTIQP